MPYYLNNASSSSSGVNIPSVVIGATVGDYIELKAVANAGNPSSNYRVAGQQSGYNNFIEIRPSAVALACGGSSITFTTGYTQPAVGSAFTIRFTRASSTTWRCTLNGSVLGSDLFNSNNCTLDAFFRFANSTSEAFRGGIYYVAISTNGGASDTRYYDPSASGGTGTVLPDTVNSANNGNQVGTWPSDNSEWVFYSSGSSSTIAVSASLPKLTGSLSLNRINPSYTVSVSGQLPKLTGTVTLNRLQPSRQIAVSGQLPKLTGAVALNQFTVTRQAAVNGILPKLTASVTLNRLQPNNQAVVSGSLPRLTASIVLRSPESYPTANPSDYTVNAYLSTGSAYTARLSGSTEFNAIISASSTFTARLN